jgi:hypothetical protein
VDTVLTGMDSRLVVIVYPSFYGMSGLVIKKQQGKDCWLLNTVQLGKNSEMVNTLEPEIDRGLFCYIPQ